MRKRATQPEILDLGPEHYSLEQLHICLEKLGQVGRWLGGDAAMRRACKRLTHKPKRILDVGCGGGFGTMLLAEIFPEAELVGVDIDEDAITFCKQRHPKCERVQFLEQSLNSSDQGFADESFDLVVVTLMIHHLSDAQLVAFLKDAYRVSRQEVLISDLQRSWISYCGFGLIAPLLFRNRIILLDGLLSIRKAFRKAELEELAEQAGIPRERQELRWQFPFRWLLKLSKR